MLNIRKLTLRHVPDDIKSTVFRRLMESEVEMLVGMSTALNFPMENIFRMKNIIAELLVWLIDFFDERILIELTRKLCHLKRLTIRVDEYQDHNITTELLKKMLSHADQLIEFHIYIAFNSIYRFNRFEIFDIVKSRANRQKLNIEITCTYTQFNPHERRFSGPKTKFIYFDIDPKFLTVKLRYVYHQLKV